MASSMHRPWLFSLLLFLIFTNAIPAYGQGGPPMITDDPFTPENGHFENNFAIQFAGTSSSKEMDIPSVDINYGYGDHIQLKIEMPVMKVLQHDDGSVLGSGNVKIGVKARFLDEEQNGIALSIFPQYEFQNASVDEGNEAPQYFLPLEAAKSFGRFHYAAEAGYSLIPSGTDALVYGVVMGYDQSEQLKLLAEFHGSNHVHSGMEELMFNVGLTYKLSSSLESLLSLGTTVYSVEPERMYAAYGGIRWTL